MKTLFYSEQSEAKQLTALERDETNKLAQACLRRFEMLRMHLLLLFLATLQSRQGLF